MGDSIVVSGGDAGHRQSTGQYIGLDETWGASPNTGGTVALFDSSEAMKR